MVTDIGMFVCLLAISSIPVMFAYGMVFKTDETKIIKRNKNGQLHCTTGPAIEYPNGARAYYINGQHYSERDFFTIVAKSPSSPI